MEVWADTVVSPQLGPSLKLPICFARTSPRMLTTAIRIAIRETSRVMVITPLNLRRKPAPLTVSRANKRTPAMLAAALGMPNREFISCANRAMVALTVTMPNRVV